MRGVEEGGRLQKNERDGSGNNDDGDGFRAVEDRRMREVMTV